MAKGRVLKIDWKKDLLFIGTLTTPAGLKMLARTGQDSDMIEVRVDALLAAGVQLPRLAAALKSRRRPVLLTLRIEKEGGRHSWPRGLRQKLFFALLPYCEAIDLEVMALPDMAQVLRAARLLRKRIILSAHAIGKPATPTLLAQWKRAFFREKADCYKVAALMESRKDLHRLASLIIDQPSKTWAVMGLGSNAALSRIVLTGLGSKLVYGFFDAPAAPGQPSLRQLHELAGR